MKARFWAQQALWAVFWLALPVSSFPHFPGFMGDSAQVRPLALYPLFFLVILGLIPRLFSRPLPKTLLPFFLFFVAALVSTLLSFAYGTEPNLGTSVESRALRTVFTLLIGVIFYLTVALGLETEADLSRALKWIYAGFGIALLWGSLQVIYILHFDRRYFDVLNGLQRLISSRKLFPKRISGLTYEPSWFAEQITFVLMPFLFAAVISKFSLFKWRYRFVTIELILLIWAAVVLLFTYSRGGLGVLIVLLTAALLIYFSQNRPRQKLRFSQWIRPLLLIGLVLLVLAGIIFLVGQKNGYFSRLWNYWSDGEAEGTFLYYIAFDQRFTYWEIAFNLFEDYPVFGVGLGNYTFYFDEYLPDRAYRTPEIFLKLVPEAGRNQIVTVKNLMIRILAETGLLGFSLFTAFLIALWGCTSYLSRSPNPSARFWGAAGFLGLMAFFVVAFSVDSFAIPNMWIVFGFITASSHHFFMKTAAPIAQDVG